jgi:multidrug efflux pump subunit AcrA (membrane-fusion protein)
VALALVLSGCGNSSSQAAAPAETKPAPVRVETARAEQQEIARFLNVSGTLVAEEEAEVAAEVQGRVVGTPVERGTQVAVGSTLVQVAAEEARAQAQEADANVAQIQARLGDVESRDFDVDKVPEVAAARASRDLARADFERAGMLYERKLVSKSEYDARQAQADNAQRQYETARNGAEQQRQALAGARARLALARKAVADTVVRAPFAGVVAERLVSVGDYVTRGTKVATVLRVNPLRLELTVPAQFISAIAVGRQVTLEVDSYPGQAFTGQVRYVSPGVRADSRALVVEAVVPNADGLLKPGLFVTARIEQGKPTPGVLVPAAAVVTTSGTSRVFVVVDNHVEERIVTIGQQVGDRVEATSGVSASEVVAVSNLARLSDGSEIAKEPGL